MSDKEHDMASAPSTGTISDRERYRGKGTQPSDANGFSKRAIGWAALCCAFVLLCAVVYFVVVVVPPMTRPTPYFDALTQRISQSAIGEDEAVDRLAVDLAVILEYTNADIRALNVQVTFSLVAGLTLAVTGLLLFAVGTKDAIGFAGGGADWHWQLSTTAPGTLALILGTVVMVTGITKQTMRPLDASIHRPEGLRLEPQTQMLPNPAVEGNHDANIQTPGTSMQPRKDEPRTKKPSSHSAPKLPSV